MKTSFSQLFAGKLKKFVFFPVFRHRNSDYSKNDSMNINDTMCNSTLNIKMCTYMCYVINIFINIYFKLFKYIIKFIYKYKYIFDIINYKI